MRVFVAVLGLGVIVGAFSSRTQKSTPSSPSSEEQINPGSVLMPASLRTLPGISLSSSEVKTTSAAASEQANPLVTAWKQSTARMKYLDHCADAGDCSGFDNTEAYSYDLDVHRQLAGEIDDFAKLTKSWMNVRGGDMPEEAQTLARYFLKTGNDDVKDSALRLIDIAPVSITNLKASIDAVEDSSSGPLMKVFLKSQMVKSSGDQSYAGLFVSLIERTMRKGSEGEQKALAKSGLALYNPYTAGALAKFEQSESPRSQKRLYLRLNREEYQRFQRGG